MEKIRRRTKGPICRPIKIPLAIPIRTMKAKGAVFAGLNIQSKKIIIEKIESPKD
jgi:hypothetical protein